MSAVTQPTVSERLSRLSESQTLAMGAKAAELEAQGQTIYKLSLGEPDFITPEHVREAAKSAIDQGFNTYSPVPGYPELRKAIAEKVRTFNGVDCTEKNIVVSTGGKQSLANVFLSLLNPGDEVLIFSPYWVTYPEIVKLADGAPVFVKGALENDYKVTPEQVRAALTPKTKIVLFSSPCNPTGSVFTEAELRGIAEVLSEREDVFIMSDEIYEHIIFEGEPFSIATIEAVKDRTIIVNGVSKAYAMTGWRCGYICAPEWIAKACNKAQGQVTSGTCTITQKAAYAAITGDQQPTKDMVEAYRRRRAMVKGLLDEIPGVKANMPQGAFYFFPDVSHYFGKSDGERTVNDSQDMAMYLLETAQVALVAGSAFGEPKALRLSYAASDEVLKEAMSRMKAALGKLK